MGLFCPSVDLSAVSFSRDRAASVGGPTNYMLSHIIIRERLIGFP
jgi:hypothetical protein